MVSHYPPLFQWKKTSTSLTSLHLLALRRPVLLLRPEAGLPLRPVGWPEAPLPECGRRHRRPANNRDVLLMDASSRDVSHWDLRPGVAAQPGAVG